jgi:hypothetical protein
MKRTAKMSVALVGAWALVMDAHGQASSVDWKMYGSTDGPSHCFFEAKGVLKIPDRHIRVWTKCLLEKDLDGIDAQKDFGGKILENAVQKIARSYVPPIALVEGNISFDQSVAITGYEETANIAPIEPQARIFYELNCSEKMIRELSISLKVGGKSGSTDKPSDWKHVAPETNSNRLLKILCSQ